MVYEEKIKICVSGAAEVSHCCSEIKKLSKELGREIAQQNCVLLTGATTGVPYFTAQGYKEAGGKFSVGFSPANSKKEHLKTYRLPIDQFDLIVYTGFDYVGRNLLLTKAADGVIIACGRTGTLNEFTIAFETKTPIGVLEKSGGTADFVEDILKKGYRPKKKIIYHENPRILVRKLLQLIKKEQKGSSGN